MISETRSTAHRTSRPRYRRRWVAFATTAAVIAGGVAGCGSSSGGAKSAKNKAPAAKTTTTTPAKEVNPAGDIPDNQAFVAYAPPQQGYTIKVPEGWARRAEGRAVVFTDKLNSIRVEQRNEPKAPTVATVTGIDVPKLARTVKNFSLVGSASEVRRTAGPAVLVRYQADGAPNDVTGKVDHLAVERYEFWRNGHAAIITLAGAKGADNVDPWKIVTNSFGWKP